MSVCTSAGVMISKLDLQILTYEFELHWMPHSHGLVPHLNKTLRKLFLICMTVSVYVCAPAPSYVYIF